jgi:hypothetical protein
MMINKLIELLPSIPSCQEATRLSSEAMERRLSIKERFDLWTHLRICDFCSQFSKQVHGLRNVLRNYTPQGEKKLPQDIKNKIKLALK